MLCLLNHMHVDGRSWMGGHQDLQQRDASHGFRCAVATSQPPSGHPAIAQSKIGRTARGAGMLAEAYMMVQAHTLCQPSSSVFILQTVSVLVCNLEARKLRSSAPSPTLSQRLCALNAVVHG